MKQPDPHAFDEALDAAAAAARGFIHGLPDRPAASALTEEPPAPLPEGMGETAAIAAFRTRFEARLSGSAGPRYWGFVTGGTTPAALAGDWLVGAYDQNLSSVVGSVAAAVEREATAWLRELFGLPADFAGAFVSGATQSNTVALAVARGWAYARLGHDVAQDGLAGAPRVPVLTGAAHASVDKALAILGMGRRSLERLPTLPGRMAVDVSALEARLRTLDGGPAIVVASAGEVNTGDFDDIAAVSALCREHGAWLHVDAAFGLFAALSPGHAGRLRGVEGADSVTTDLHKWLNVPYDAGLVFCRRPELQRSVFRATSAYLGDSPDPLHMTPENSRRFRALPVWMSVAAYGRAGIAAWVVRDCALAERLAEGIRATPGLELLSPVYLNIVCFALREGDAGARDRVLERLTGDGRVFLSPTALFGRPAIRAALSSWRTEEADVDVALEAIRDALG